MPTADYAPIALAIAAAGLLMLALRASSRQRPPANGRPSPTSGESA